jgi:oligogalacturonide lyase
VTDGEGRKGKAFPSAWSRYSDPATELDVIRLTAASVSSALPAYYSRAVSRDSARLLFSSDLSGARQAFEMNLKSGAATQLTEAEGLDRVSLSFLPGDRAFCYAAGRGVYSASLATLNARLVYSVPAPWELGSGLSVDSTGARLFLVERLGERRRLRVVPRAGGEPHSALETTAGISDPIPCPGRTWILYRQGAEALWLIDYAGASNRRLPLAPGRIGPAQWSPEGGRVLYLSSPEDPSRLSEIREYDPARGADQLVGQTSQYAHFGFNRDTSVFVGASRSLASPVVVLMLRVNGRELTLCEHRASRPETVAPIFAPDAQRIYFQSDRDGQPALYGVPVERLVEKIEAGRW